MTRPTRQIQLGDRVRPKGVRPHERGRSWLGTVAAVNVEYPRGSDTPYRTLTVRSDRDEMWVADQRDWLPANGNGKVRAGPRYMYPLRVRVGWYDVGAWSILATLVIGTVAWLPCGLLLLIPGAFILSGYARDRKADNRRAKVSHDPGA